MRENGFYWVKHEGMRFVAEWGYGHWYLPGISSRYTDNDFTYIADQPIKASIE